MTTPVRPDQAFPGGLATPWFLTSPQPLSRLHRSPRVHRSRARLAHASHSFPRSLPLWRLTAAASGRLGLETDCRNGGDNCTLSFASAMLGKTSLFWGFDRDEYEWENGAPGASVIRSVGGATI
jgi:hypothetical protein